ncbi:hypothetical protein RSAG8_11719, partial [Rhizoctonia solani AG-8 WAC10335]
MGRKKSGKSVQSQRGSHTNGSRVARNTAPQTTNLKFKKRNRNKQFEQPKQSEQPKQPEKPEQPNPVQPRAYLSAFFENYSSFDYDRSKPVMSEFYRMCDRFGWERDNEEREDARDNLRDAMVQEFNAIYGTDHESLAAWQSLCRVLNLTNVPNKLEACRQVS